MRVYCCSCKGEHARVRLVHSFIDGQIYVSFFLHSNVFIFFLRKEIFQILSGKMRGGPGGLTIL